MATSREAALSRAAVALSRAEFAACRCWNAYPANGGEHQRRERRHQAVQPPGAAAFCLLADVLLGD